MRPRNEGRKAALAPGRIASLRPGAQHLDDQLGKHAMAITTVDHEEIRKWGEAKGGKPAAVDRTHKGEDVGIIRLMFPNSEQSEHQHLVEISWDEFFEKFEESKLALIYEKESLFSKLVGRENAEHGSHGARASHQSHASPGRQHANRSDR